MDKKRVYVKRKEFLDEKADVDEKDMLILKSISQKSNMSLVELHENTGVAINTLKSRITRMQKNKIILGFRPFIDTAKTGYKYFKVNLNMKNYTKDDLKKISAYVEADSRLVYVSTYINGDDFELELHFRDERELNEYKKELRKEFGRIIREINVYEFTKEHIFRYLPEE